MAKRKKIGMDTSGNPVYETPIGVDSKQMAAAIDKAGGGTSAAKSKPSGSVLDNSFIKEREKTIGALQRTGMSLAGATRQAAKQMSAITPAMDFTSQKQIEAAGQIGNVTPGMKIEAGLANQPGSLLEGIGPEMLAKGAIGAAGGAVTGAIGGGGVGAIPGAAIGGAAGIITGILGNLKSEAIQNTKVQKVTYTTSKTNIKAILEGVNKGIIDPIDGVNLYNRELAKIDAAESNLKSLADYEWLSKAKDELVSIEQFNSIEREKISLMLEQAILRPNPAVTYDIPIETVDMEEIQ